MTTASPSLFLLDTPSALAPLDDLDWSVLLSSDHESGDERQAALSAGESHAADSSDSTCADACARRRERRAASARRRRAQSKNTVEALRVEADALEAQLVALRGHRAATNWYEIAAVEKRRRQQAEDEHRQLKHALAGLRTNVQDLSMFLSVGFLSAGVNMRDLLHTYTHLTRDPSRRASDYLAVCSQQKLDLAFEIATRETLRMSGLSPQVIVQPVVSRDDEFAITLTARIVLDTTDLSHAFVVAGRAHLACTVAWAAFRQLKLTPRVTEFPTQQMRYWVSEEQHVSESTGEVVVVEENSLAYWKLNPSCGVIVWDFVDVDELYPSTPGADARRNNIAALVVRRELCADGVERVVCSTVCTKIYQFLPSSKPIVALDTVGSATAIASDIKAASQLMQRTIIENLHLTPSGNGLH